MPNQWGEPLGLAVVARVSGPVSRTSGSGRLCHSCLDLAIVGLTANYWSPRSHFRSTPSYSLPFLSAVVPCWVGVFKSVAMALAHSMLGPPPRFWGASLGPQLPQLSPRRALLIR